MKLTQLVSPQQFEAGLHPKYPDGVPVPTNEEFLRESRAELARVTAAYRDILLHCKRTCSDGVPRSPFTSIEQEVDYMCHVLYLADCAVSYATTDEPTV